MKREGGGVREVHVTWVERGGGGREIQVTWVERGREGEEGGKGKMYM